MANYICHVIVEDLEEHRDALQCYLVANDNTSATTHVNTLIGDIDGHLDGEIVGANLEKIVAIDLPTGLKANAVGGSRVEQKIQMIFKSSNPNPDKRTSITLPARSESSLEEGSLFATDAFVTDAEALFISTSLPQYGDYDFSALTRLISAREAYKSRETKRWS